MARKIRDGAMFVYLNAVLMLLCREFFNINEYLEKRILFVATAATILWYIGQTFLNEKKNDKDKMRGRENKCPFSNFGYGQCEMFHDFVCPLHKDDQEDCEYRRSVIENH